MPPCAERLIGVQVIESSVPVDQCSTLDIASSASQATPIAPSDTLNHPLSCPDLLELVFTACANANFGCCDISRVLSQVSHDWRTFILSSPKYWTNVKMRCGGTEGKHLWTKVLLERSQSQPIAFHLYVTAPFHCDEVKRVIYQHAGRIHKLIIS